MRRRAQHADRLPLRAALQGEDRRARHGQDARRRAQPRRGAEGAAGHPDLRRGRRDADRRYHQARRARDPRQGRKWRLRQRLFQDLDQPGPAPRQSRPAGRGGDPDPAPQAHRRRGAGRAAERRQVHLPRRGHRREAEDRRLSLHDAASGLGRGAGRRARVRARRHSGPDRGRARGLRPRRPLPQPCRALPGAAAPGRRDMRTCRPGLQGDPPRAGGLWRGPRREARDRRALQGRRARPRHVEGAGGAAEAGGEARAPDPLRRLGPGRGRGAQGADGGDRAGARRRWRGECEAVEAGWRP